MFKQKQDFGTNKIFKLMQFVLGFALLLLSRA